MRRKCLCGIVHDFKPFERFRTTWGGKKSHYQKFCEKLNKLIILTITTYPTSVTAPLCPTTTLKKFKRVENMFESREFINAGYMT